MKLNNLHGFDNICSYVKFKLNEYSGEKKDLESLFNYMFDETDNIMVETSDGYRIKKTTYGEFKKSILEITPTVCDILADVPTGEMIGLYMSNCVEWIQIFWAILASGYTPLLMNTRLSDEVLEGILVDYSVKCVISDGKIFSVKTALKEEIIRLSDKPYTYRPFGDEVVFMSSGTTNDIKLCAYNGENFFYQICDSANILEQCSKMGEHYEGELKHLVLLPFYHVFGFIAVYLWFGFFSRTFVFPKDLSPDTVQRTVKKHKVTHIFAVPMVWESICKIAMRKIKAKGENTLRNFNRSCTLVNSLGKSGDLIASHLLGEVREAIFGDSIRFLITGGSNISPETVRFFNGIGYHLVNGYGMTEIGITSFEKSRKRKDVNKCSIGAPFGYTEYALDECSRLLVKGKTRAARIMQKGKVTLTNYDEWFNTGDIMRYVDGRYYADGRSDDLIVSENGDNLNPTIAERELKVNGVDSVCIFNGRDGVTLLLSVPGIYSNTVLKAICGEVDARLVLSKLNSTVSKIILTHEKLLRDGEIKLSRKKIAQRVEQGEMSMFNPRNIDDHVCELMSGLEKDIISCFAEALGKDSSQIQKDADFFRDLGGTSLDYFTLLKIIATRIGIDFLADGNAKFSTVKDFAEYIEKYQSSI